jgi:SAM-dependent methyltransferase/uncharacterized protein YbaR (Trm112 family)
MRAHFLKYLVDPATGEDLEIKSATEKNGDIVEGFLVSKSNKYPIVRGIPRFAGFQDDKNYAKSFGYQWNKWSKIQFDSENVGGKMANYTLKMWDNITHVQVPDLKRGVVVDFGCGSGRFLETIRQKNGVAIGFDLSDAVEAAGEIFANDPDVLICQADILKSPIRPNSTDGAFSIGVLHHTKDAKIGFDQMVKCVKPGGWISVSLYSPGGYYDNFIVNIYRKIFKATWPIFKHYPPLIYTYLTIYLLRPLLRIPILRTLIRPFLTFFPFMDIPDTRWSILNTFDSITPSNQYAFTTYQVFQWFKSAGLKEIEPSNWAGASIYAKK